MSGPLHDGAVYLGLACFDLAVVVTWWFLGSHFVPGEGTGADAGWAPSAEPPLHRVLSAICLFLLIGLILECSGSAVWYVARYGFSR